MTLYWLTIAALLSAGALSVHGGVAATAAGSRFWLRFHTRAAIGASVACVLFAIFVAPVAATL